MKSFEDFRDELVELKHDVLEQVIEAIGPDCNLELHRLKGYHQCLDDILEKFRRIIKHHDCDEHWAYREGVGYCLMCGDAGDD